MPYISKQEVKKLVENLERFGLFKVTTDKGTVVDLPTQLSRNGSPPAPPV